jgi:predicted dehydrogenase
MRVGMIGAGDIAQIMHLPYLAEIPEVDLHAIADPGTNVVETLGERYNVPNRYEDTATLIDDLADELDAVVIATPMHTHAESAVAALESDLHTFVEKPVAVTPSDAEKVVQATEQSNAECMVGYMKRYNPAFQRFEREVAAAGTIDLITSVVLPPDVGGVIEETYDIVRAELDEEFLAKSNQKRMTQMQRAIGTDDETLVQAYGYHLESICHDVNALRSLFGSVEQIDHVDVFNDGRYATAQFQYEGGRRCLLESGATNRKWYDERIQVDTAESALTIAFGNAFIRNAPADVRVKRGTDEIIETQHDPSYEEAFKRELEHFVECIAKDATERTPTGKARESVKEAATVRTPPEEAKKDIELIAELFQTFVEQG